MIGTFLGVSKKVLAVYPAFSKQVKAGKVILCIYAR